ncbi:MAG TPA: hypothetical protein VFJ47_11535, partial [Terriglobales bacterium]|nr:hypothetical protein [Terriglobales bacterium]
MSLPQGQQWLARHRKEYITAGDAWLRAKRNSYGVPSDSGRKTALARLLSSVFTEKLEGLLWIRDWSAFPSSANLDLFYGYRKYLGDERLLIDAPCHIFSSGDTDSVQSLLCMSLYFYWDTVLVASDWDVVVTTSNDEFIDLYGDQGEQGQELARKFE